MGRDTVKYVWLVMVRERFFSWVKSAHGTQEGAEEAKATAVIPNGYNEIYITRWRVEK